MKFRVEKDFFGDDSIPNGIKEVSCVVTECEECGCELSGSDEVYNHEGDMVCEDCLLEFARAGTVEELFAERSNT